MKKFILMAAMMLSMTSVYAQHEVGSVSIQPKAGITISNYVGKDADDAKFKLGYAFGADVEYQVSDWLGLSAGLAYDLVGAKNKETDTDDGVKYSYTEKLNAGYLNIPIVAHFYIAKGLAVNAGIQPGFLLSAKAKQEFDSSYAGSSYKGSESYDVKDRLKKFDLSIPVGLSYEYSNFVLDARYNVGLIKAGKEFKETIGGTTYTYPVKDVKNGFFQITLGYRFDL